MAYITRITRDYNNLIEDPIQNCKVKLGKNELLTTWNITMDGPSDSIYENTKMKIELCFNASYPLKPPTAKFITKIYHPNVSDDGTICIDTLKKNWTPLFTPSIILLSISSLLTDPNPEDPLNAEAAALYKKNVKEYENRAKQCLS